MEWKYDYTIWLPRQHESMIILYGYLDNIGGEADAVCLSRNSLSGTARM